MQSRMDRYQSKDNKQYARTTKNTELYKKVYEDIYSDTSYKNMSIIDNAKEISINKLKNIIDDKYDNKQYRTLQPYSIEDISINDKIELNDNDEVYDINKIIDDAKKKRAFIDETKEKQKYLEFEKNRNEKYKERYDELRQEEEELEELINTMTIPLKQQDDDLMADLMGDDNTIVTKPVETDFDGDTTKEEVSESTEIQTNITNKLNKMDKTFYTDSNMFTKNDFEDFSSIKKELDRSRVVKKVIIITSIAIIIIAACYFGYQKYILK